MEMKKVKQTVKIERNECTQNWNCFSEWPIQFECVCVHLLVCKQRKPWTHRD